MSYFDPNRGMFHFAFVQEDDLYCTGSGMMIKSVPYLYSLLHNLRRNNPVRSFFHVCHTGGIGNSFLVTYTGFKPLPPPPPPQQNGFFFKNPKTPKAGEAPAVAHRGIFDRETVSGIENVMGNYVLSSMEQKEDSVCMITADAFCEIRDPLTIQRLTELNSVNRKSGRGHLFIILCPINRDISGYFTDRSSILRSAELFPETDRLFRDNGSHNFLLYDELLKAYGERFAVFDTRSPENVSNVLKLAAVQSDGEILPEDTESAARNISWKLFTAPESIFGRYNASGTVSLEKLILKDRSLAEKLLSPAPENGCPEFRKLKNSLWQNAADHSGCGEKLLRLYDALTASEDKECAKLAEDCLRAALSFRKTLCDNAEFTYLFRHFLDKFVSFAENAVEENQPELLAAAAESIIFFAGIRASLSANEYRIDEMRHCCLTYEVLYDLCGKKCAGVDKPTQPAAKKVFSLTLSGSSSGIDGDIKKLREKIRKLTGGVKNLDTVKNEIEEIRQKYAEI